MRVGIANPFSYRPHVGHMVFIVRQLKRLGYSPFYLGCGGNLENCNSKVNKVGLFKKLECLKCRIGGLRSYLKINSSRMDLNIPLSKEDIDIGYEMSFSTACTALRIEHISEAKSVNFKNIQHSMAESVARVYLNTRRWIRENKLESVFIFNGRMDVTRAILEACRAESTRFISVERSWFGDGLQLLPEEDCLGLRNYHDICRLWASRPLKYDQAIKACQLIRRRLKRTSVGEWRQYNINTSADYKKDNIKYLFLPSSQHEWLGDQGRSSEWLHPVEGIEYLFDRLGINLNDLVVRGHPGWNVKIGSATGDRVNQYYRDWAEKTGVKYIDPSENVDTHNLIKNSRMILLNGSSASMEAAYLGKPIISFVPSAYTTSGISMNIFNKDDVDNLSDYCINSLINPEIYVIDPEAQCMLALRFIYCTNFRIMQFVDSVKSTSPYSFEIDESPCLDGFESLVLSGILKEDDSGFDSDDKGEKLVIEAILTGNYDLIDSKNDENPKVNSVCINRRKGYKLIDMIFN